VGRYTAQGARVNGILRGEIMATNREQLKEHAITLRKQGWTERAILGVKTQIQINDTPADVYRKVAEKKVKEIN
jgi:hypothetical protein